jgi:hypothetical protein
LDLNYFNKNFSESPYAKEESLERMLKIVDSELITTLQFRYTKVLNRIGPEVTLFKNLDLDTTFGNVYKITTGLVKTILDEIQEADSQEPNSREKTVIIRIPNTHDSKIVNNLAIPTFHKNSEFVRDNRCPILSFEGSRSFWNKLRNIDYYTRENKNLIGDDRDILPDFKISPEDLYSSVRIREKGVPCSMAAPIINKMALFFIQKNANGSDARYFNQGENEVELIVEDKVTIPYKGYNSEYNIIAPDWRLIPAPVRVSESIRMALTEFNSLKTQAGQGIPPFTRFSIDKFEGLQKSCGPGVQDCKEEDKIQMIANEFLVDHRDSENTETEFAGTIREAVVIMELKSMYNTRNAVSHILNCQ